MGRRYSASQIRNMLRQAQQKQRQAISQYNQAVRKHNQAVRQHNQKVNQAINQFNSAVRSYNARVRANQQRLRSEFSRLQQRSTTTRYVVYQSSATRLYNSYVRLDADGAHWTPEYNRLLDLSEREAANSLAVANGLAGEPMTSPADGLYDAELGDRLKSISEDLNNRWQGAVFALNPANPDAARHFCTSTREIFTQLIEMNAPDITVRDCFANCELTERGNPTRRSKIKYLLHQKGLYQNALEEFIEQDMENIVDLFRTFNDGTHGSAGTFGVEELGTIKKRVEDGITFLTELLV
jgi:uncharacterized protein YukE